MQVCSYPATNTLQSRRESLTICATEPVGVTKLLTAPSLDPSFPSDHATAAFAIALTFACTGMPRRAAGFGVAALVVAFSRVYIGTHYASDVLGGALTGALATAFVTTVYMRNTRFDRFITGIF
ncbi:phosphatase PAP2 family protein [Cypionkella sp. TWP1-2-1b2]|uniref:phosphatase PAP2 family protein n=1 Tax=Cypionkella sp. TWP1-2-1b2 TaxID=2804675 RepID=UPI003CEE5E49